MTAPRGPGSLSGMATRKRARHRAHAPRPGAAPAPATQPAPAAPATAAGPTEPPASAASADQPPTVAAAPGAPEQAEPALDEDMETESDDEDTSDEDEARETPVEDIVEFERQPEVAPQIVRLAEIRRPEGKLLHTREWYDAFVAAYLQFPGNHTAVARALNVTRFACRTVWNDGWKRMIGTGGLNNDGPRRFVPLEWAPPIKEKIAEYQALARAKLEEERARQEQRVKDQDEALRDAVDKAKRDIIDSRALQGRVIKTARGNSIALMAVSGNLLQAGVDLSKRVRTLMSDPTWKPTPKQALYMLRTMAEITKMGIEAAHIADDMERRALGEPDMILGIETNMTRDDAINEIRNANAALNRSEHFGGLRALPPPVDEDDREAASE